MRRHTLFATIASIAVVASAPTLAKPGGGGGAGVNAGGAVRGSIDAGPKAKGSVDGAVKARGSTEVDRAPLTGTRLRSTDGPDAQSSARAMGKVGFGTDISGMTVVDGEGTSVGTVTGVTAKGNGSVRTVQVTLTDGQIVTLAPNSLTLDGDTLTTTSVETNVRSQGAANANINGLINASPNSALASAGVTSLTGLNTGLTVQNSAGASVGTVGQIFTNQSGAVVAVQVNLTGGGTVNVPATSLSIDGTTVISSSTSL